MLKSLLKFGYIALAIVLGVVVGMGSYVLNVNESAISKITATINDKDYITLTRLYSGSLCDGTDLSSSFESDSDYNIYMNAGVMDYTGTYYTINENNERVETYFHSFDETYYMYFTDVKFLIGDSTGSLGKTIHYAGIEFVSNDNEYDYYFDLNSTYNAPTEDDYEVITITGDDGFKYNKYSDTYNGYIDTPYSEKELLLNSERYLSNFYSNYGFLPVSFTKTQIDTIEELLGGDITSFRVIDADGNAVSSDINFTFDFTEEFFSDASPLIEAQAKFIPISDKYGGVSGATYSSDVSQSEYEAAVTLFNESVEEFAYKLNNKYLFEGFDTYYPPLSDDFIKTSSVVGKVVAIVAIYILAAVILYFLFFHIKDISNFIYNRRNGGTSARGIAPKQNSITVAPKEVNTKEDNTKEVEEKENNK